MGANIAVLVESLQPLGDLPWRSSLGQQVQRLASFLLSTQRT